MNESAHLRAYYRAKRQHTRSGSHKDSAVPNNLSLAVPATTKSFGRVKHPIRSVPAMKGLLPSEGLDSPAIIGSTKYGPNLFEGFAKTVKAMDEGKRNLLRTYLRS